VALDAGVFASAHPGGFDMREAKHV
jgi:hypothetical protein